MIARAEAQRNPVSGVASLVSENVRLKASLIAEERVPDAEAPQPEP
jgi:hypothetical protein